VSYSIRHSSSLRARSGSAGRELAVTARASGSSRWIPTQPDAVVTLETPHREMRIVAEGIADIDEDVTVLPPRRTAFAARVPAPTSLTRADAALRDWRAPSRASPVSPLRSWTSSRRSARRWLTNRDHRRHALGRRSVGSRVGVCQDQAHVLVACCRASGVPARYVSGYFHGGDTGESRPRLGRRLARRGPRLAEPRRDARGARGRPALPPGGRARLP